ncbi:TniQ family protein [Cytobacillus solani]|uniref:TniQ family protein n=1 Tax=Cytobacillus solani TaxID=1637975 RepID=UPI0011503B15|nr:TniQ family protein [Cytobacillus solani]
MKGHLLNDRSVLYNIEPFGIGTSEVESFTSYLMRVAYEHNVSIGHLINKLVAAYLNKEYLERSSIFGGNRFYEGAKTINGYMENSKDIVGVMEMITSRSDLSNLTLSRWKDFIPLRNLLKDTLTWCPECIQSWMQSGQHIYYPLIWYIKSVRVCLKHSCFLVEVCPACNKRVDILRRQMIGGYCSNCFTSLAQFGVIEKLDLEELKWQTFVVQNIKELLKIDISNLKNPRDQIIDQLNLVYRKIFSEDIVYFSNYLNTPKSTLRYWLSGQNFPCIENLIKILFKVNMNISNVLFEVEKNMMITQPIILEYRHEKIYKEIRRPLKYDVIEEKFKELLTSVPPVSMNIAAKKIGHDKRVLYKNFPDYCKQISKKYNDFVKEKSRQRIEMLKEEIKKSFISLKNEGIYPSRRKIEEKVNKRGVLKEKILQEYWKYLLRSSGFHD